MVWRLKRNIMNKYPTVNLFHKKEIDEALKTLEAIKRYKHSLSVELIKKYATRVYWIVNLEKGE